MVRALIEVSITPQKDVGFDSIAERIYSYPEVKSCYLLSGGYDLLVIVEGESIHTKWRILLPRNFHPWPMCARQPHTFYCVSTKKEGQDF